MYRLPTSCKSTQHTRSSSSTKVRYCPVQLDLHTQDFIGRTFHSSGFLYFCFQCQGTQQMVRDPLPSPLGHANNINNNDTLPYVLPKCARLKPVLNWANVCSPNILRTIWRTMIRFLIELLVRRTWFGQSKLYFVLNWLVMRCKLRPELAADAQQTAWSQM